MTLNSQVPLQRPEVYRLVSKFLKGSSHPLPSVLLSTLMPKEGCGGMRAGLHMTRLGFSPRGPPWPRSSAVTVVQPLNFMEALVLLLSWFSNTFCPYPPVPWTSHERTYSYRTCVWSTCVIVKITAEKCDQHVLLLKSPTNIHGLVQWTVRAKRKEWTIPTLI